MRIIVAGCGYVGGRAAQELARAGHEVIGIRRKPGGIPDGVRELVCDVSQSASLLPDADALIYSVSADGREESLYRRAYVDGLRNCLAQLEGSVRKVIFTSSTAVYGQNAGEWVNEDSPTHPSGFTGRILLEAEALLKSGSFEGCALRLSGIYGPSRTRLIRSVHTQKSSATPRYTNRIHLDDCAGSLSHLLTRSAPLKPRYVGVDNCPVLSTEVYAFVASVLGIATPERSEQSPIGKRCDNTLLRDSGYTFRVDSFKEGYPDMIKEYLESLEP